MNNNTQRRSHSYSGAKLKPSRVLRFEQNGASTVITLDELVDKLLRDLTRPVTRKHGNLSNQKREEAIALLNTLNMFLMELSNCQFVSGDVSNIIGTLNLLSLSLRDLRQGSVAPILKPERAYNRSLLPTYIRITRAHAAAAMEALIRAGMKRPAAAQDVAKQISGWDNILMSSSASPPWKSVSRWRDELKIRTRGKSSMNGDLNLAEYAYLQLIEIWEKFTDPNHPNYTPQYKLALQLISMRKHEHDSGKGPC